MLLQKNGLGVSATVFVAGLPEWRFCNGLCCGIVGVGILQREFLKISLI
jgi:hypothetical protein